MASRRQRVSLFQTDPVPELGIAGAAGQEIMRYQHTYPGRDTIVLIFFRVTQFGGEPRNVVFHEMRWEPALKLGEFDFVEGDLEFIRANQERESSKWRS